MDSNIQFVGQLDAPQLSNFLGKALFTVVPSLWFENLPNSILESYACATPVIASDIGSLSGSVKKGVTGDLFKTGDSDDLADKIEFYLNNSSIINEMAINSRIEAVNIYSPKFHIKCLEQLFNKFV
jgi:glycosyltransferase involved in cell wall biosynthesis